MKLLTLNINYDEPKHGPWKARRALIADAVRRHAPDIVALQAVREPSNKNGALNQAAEVASDVPGYGTIVFEPVQSHADGRRDGSAFLLRRPYLERHAFKLSLAADSRGEMPQDRTPRLVLAVRLEHPALVVFNSHFSWVYGQTVSNVSEALAYMSRFAGPRVLMGDFNAMPDAPVLEQFRQAGWVDAWTTLRAGDPGHTFESNAPDKRIDYVWVSSDLAPRLHAIDIVSAPPGSDVRLSDHHGICVTLAESP